MFTLKSLDMRKISYTLAGIMILISSTLFATGIRIDKDIVPRFPQYSIPYFDDTPIPSVPADVTLTCPTNVTEPACQTQSSIDAKFIAWKETAIVQVTCSTYTITYNDVSAPNSCGGSSVLMLTVSSVCSPPQTCTATFTVENSPPVIITCATNETIPACLTQAEVDERFRNWLNTTSFTGGCNGILANNGATAPNACGGTTSVSFTVTSDCETPKTCTATITVTPAPAVTVICPINKSVEACKTQSEVDRLFLNWTKSLQFSGGCNTKAEIVPDKVPSACGSVSSVRFIVSSSCETDKICISNFLVESAPKVVLDCPAPIKITDLNDPELKTKFENWKNEVTHSGGCNSILTNNGNFTPAAGCNDVTFRITSDCEIPVECTTSFMVGDIPAISLTCPSNVTEAACQTQASIDEKFILWKNTSGFTGGCAAKLTASVDTAPNACGGTLNVTFSVQSASEPPKTCSASFSVMKAPDVVLNCPANTTEAPCQTQSAIDAKFNAWKNTSSFIGGCNGVFTNSGTTPPNACGGVASVTFTVTSDCEGPKTCTATFAVTPTPPVVLTCPANITEAACQTQSVLNTKFNEWKNTASLTGSCSGVLTNSGASAPDKCGGTSNVTFTVISSCDAPVTCNSRFTVTDAPPVAISCPKDITISNDLLNELKIEFDKWKNSVSSTGGCNSVMINNSVADPIFGVNEVTFTVTSDCDSSKNCTAKFTAVTIVVDPALPVHLDFVITPNPVTDNLRIILKGEYSGELEINIIDQTGKILYNWSVEKNRYYLDLEPHDHYLITGNYIISVNAGNDIISKSFHVSRK